MARLTDEQIEQARRRWDVIAAEVKLKPAGRELVGLCPWHQEKSPSFYIVPDKGFAHCFGCGWTGNPIDHVMQRHGLGFVEAVEALLDLPPQRTPTRLPSPQAAPDRADRQSRIAEILAGCGPVVPGTAAHMYLQMRGLSRPQPALLGHPALYCHEARRLLPALVAPSTNSRGQVTALQRIWLVDRVVYDGTSPAPKDNRAPVATRKQSIGSFGDGAVRLRPAGMLLGLAEGIETACAASDAYSFPVWAVCGLSRLGFPEHYRQRQPRPGEAPEMWITPALPPRAFDAVHVPARPPSVWIPPGVERLVIFGDNGGIGEVVAQHAAQAYRRRLDVHTTVQLPPAGFSDFNSEILDTRDA